MSPAEFDPQSGPYEAFFNSLGKTLSRFKLYTPNHPMTIESIQNTFQSLQTCLQGKQEMTIAYTGEDLLVDGNPAKTMAGARDIQALLQKYNLLSLTFQNGISLAEMNSFFKFLTLKEGTIKNSEDLRNFLVAENVLKIQIDAAFYAKIGEGETPGAGAGAAAGPGGSEGSSQEQTEKWIKKLQNLPVEAMLMQLIEQAIPDPEARKRVFELIINQLKNELEDYVRKATQRLEQEKQRISNIQERTESVIKNIAEGTVILDENGQIIMMNQAAEKIYGATLSELKGKKLGQEHKQEVMITLAKELTNTPNKDFSNEVTVQSDDNTQQVIKSSTAMIQNPDGKIVGVMSLLNDIARQKELQRMQNDFMAHVTHELRSPLTAIKAALGTLFDDSNANMSPSQQQILTIANRNIERLARLINDLLDCAKIGAGKMTVDAKEMEIVPLLNESVVSLQSWAKNKGIELSLANLPALPKVLGDSDRLTQVLVNLISNAIKFTPRDGKIKVSAAPASGLFVKVSVTDTGPGISKEMQAKLFERFYQLRQTEKTDTPGTGLGLYIARSIVELHKGDIGIESEAGKGSTFYFTLPVATQQKKEPAQIEMPKPIGGIAAPEKRGWFSKLFGGK